jgi:glycosyltransferase involved in cell wall biosynthesis
VVNFLLKEKKILFVAHHRLDRSPGQRYRFEQYFSYLNENGFSCELANIISEKDDQILYNSYNYLKKGFIALNAYRKRYLNYKSIKNYDLIVLYREAVLTRSIIFEKLFSDSGVPLVFDFDDAIWIKDISKSNKMLAFLKNENKIEKILPLCAHVTCGNEYLKEYASRYNSKVTIIPSTVNTDLYVPMKLNGSSEKVKIGWVGSHTTIKHFQKIINVYKRLKEKYKDNISFKVIGDANYKNDELEIVGEKWDNNKEVELFNSFDIGVMPLPKDEWTEGKCGMKGLLYMSTGKPAVVSSVGANNSIIEHGENGFLCSGEDHWFNTLSLLIDDADLRNVIGMKGRKTIEDKYSTISQRDKYLNLYLSLINNQ